MMFGLLPSPAGRDACRHGGRDGRSPKAWCGAGFLAPQGTGLRAGLTLNGNGRFLYAPVPVTLTPSLTTPALTSLGITNGAFKLRVSAFPGQTVVTEASTNLAQWTAVATNIVSGTGFNVADPLATATPARYFRAKLRP